MNKRTLIFVLIGLLLVLAGCQNANIFGGDFIGEDGRKEKDLEDPEAIVKSPLFEVDLIKVLEVLSKDPEAIVGKMPQGQFPLTFAHYSSNGASVIKLQGMVLERKEGYAPIMGFYPVIEIWDFYSDGRADVIRTSNMRFNRESDYFSNQEYFDNSDSWLKLAYEKIPEMEEKVFSFSEKEKENEIPQEVIEAKSKEQNKEPLYYEVMLDGKVIRWENRQN